ncbi:ABC transporter substrate-binding protein [Aquincola sp. S2]|uniref:ABC transporter substrate-binding protein n=1 Tax=Pseudaquabacterium terrae TaxID=2732868 RepID=A0ABX2EEQ3_9BURK|nr:ABC transporter substrate-binding protein [Aquabacterium terrae]NRF67096.1 ABC transporter substrate-binding protein [Aquabacterium terrae]
MKKPFLLLLLIAAIAFLLPRDAWPQKAEAMHRIGILVPGKPPAPDAPKPPPSELVRVFQETLAKQGYVEGKNLTIELRIGEYERLPALARELERLKVEVIWVIGTRAVRIVQEVVKRTPLVMYSCDPFEHVAKLSRPGSNVTGTTCMTTELSPKRLELLKELLPEARRVVFFGDPEDAPLGWRLTREAAPKLGIAIQMVPYKDRDSIPAALEKIAKIKPDAVFVYPDVILGAQARKLAQFWLEHSLPSMNAFPFFADTGGLMAYGAINAEVGAMMGGQVAKILDGARPGDVPVQRATQFHLVINLQTAKALGVKVPQSLRIRADRVIE